MKPENLNKIVSPPQYIANNYSSNVGNLREHSRLKETKELTGILNAGALPVHLEEIYSTSVGAQFGEQALTKRFMRELSVLR